jgi:hypothetical protein
VNETRETKSFDTIEEARQWAAECKRTLGLWSGDVTFKCEKSTTEEVAL